MHYTQPYPSPLGPMTIASDGQAIIGLWFDRQRYDGAGLSADAVEKPVPVLLEAARWLDGYFGGSPPETLPALAPAGTPFRQAVWKLLLTIPYGETRTYGWIAAQLAAMRGQSRLSAQAVGGAVGHNPIALMIPCHRVIGAKGQLTGYAAGIEKKAQLLAWEQGLQP